jgi:hypothetical protein
MKKVFLILLLFVFTKFTFSQEVNKESKHFSDTLVQFPVFDDCKNLHPSSLENCFYDKVQNLVLESFIVPENLHDFKGQIKVLFEVNSSGFFKVIYINAVNDTLIEETKRVFSKLPQITPSTYNGSPTYSKYTITISLPLKNKNNTDFFPIVNRSKSQNKNVLHTELDSIVYKNFNSPQFKSHLNIPFSHSYYSRFDMALNQLGVNNHTASKPLTFSEVSKYYDFSSENEKLKKKGSSWWSRKLWNENLVEIQGEGYWFTLNPIVDLQIGTASGNKQVGTFINTRGINFRGELGSQISFSTTVFESQGKFADYFNRYAESIKPAGGNPAIIPGIGIAKDFKIDAYDFPLAEANLTYVANKFLDLQLGYGRNFVGDGYRSLLVSDGASPYPYFKINTNFWKIKYINTFMWLKDIRPEVTIDRTYTKKFMANHYLSWNISNRLNLGLFESVVWSDSNNRGFDMSFVNPIIFYRSVEFASSSRSGNALLGFTAKYKYNNQINFYGQFLLDEFSLGEVKTGNNSWKNKFGYQLGFKYYNAFQVDNLVLQLEFNHIRPFVYSHSDPITNYGSYNQSIGHPWGGNFEEFLFIARYHKGRIFVDTKITSGLRGLDFDTAENSFNYGGNIYKDYDLNRSNDSGVKVGQGNKTTVFIADLQVGYVLNPITNLKFFGSFIYRNFDPTKNTLNYFKETTSWFSLGIRSDIFNWYFDY